MLLNYFAVLLPGNILLKWKQHAEKAKFETEFFFQQKETLLLKYMFEQ